MTPSEVLTILEIAMKAVPWIEEIVLALSGKVTMTGAQKSQAVLGIISAAAAPIIANNPDWQPLAQGIINATVKVMNDVKASSTATNAQIAGTQPV